MQKQDNRIAAGFTLPELLVVIAIVSVVALVAAPWFARVSQRNKLRSGAREVQTTLLAARMIAVRTGQPASVRIAPAPVGTAHHRLETWLEAAPPRRMRELLLTTQVRFISLPPGNDVVFTADGRRDPPATAHEDIVIEGPVGSALMNQITLQTWENGRVEFVFPTEWR